MALFDSHLHIARLPEPLEVAQELHERGYRYRAVACEPWEWKAVQELWEKASAEGWQEGCGFAFGIHPMIAADIANKHQDDSSEDCWSELRRLLKKIPDAQVGEAGLDKRYAGYEPGGAQEAVFRRQQAAAGVHVQAGEWRILSGLCRAGYGAVKPCDSATNGFKTKNPVIKDWKRENKKMVVAA